ncbi:hypothetical protein AO370_1156 [Moraxella catarrhalis]|uniref:Uncharacterized protein n=1 Tax=Moraxella catarrhalis TaxID=480 RepID=A0AB36DMU2_MORCA|nr:hypothetical protein AO370_1156 [Moraxella catarrhalis]
MFGRGFLIEYFYQLYWLIYLLFIYKDWCQNLITMTVS